MLGVQQQVHHGAAPEVAVANVGVAVVALDADAAAAKLAALEGPVVLVELQDRGPAPAVLEPAVLHQRLGGGLVATGIDQQTSVGAIDEGHVLVADFRDEAGAVHVAPADAGPPAPVEDHADVAAVEEPVGQDHPPARRAVPDDSRVAPAADQQDAQRPAARQALEGQGVGDPVRPGRQVDGGTLLDPAERGLERRGVVRHPVPDRAEGFHIDPIRNGLPGEGGKGNGRESPGGGTADGADHRQDKQDRGIHQMFEVHLPKSYRLAGKENTAGKVALTNICAIAQQPGSLAEVAAAPPVMGLGLSGWLFNGSFCTQPPHL